MFAPYGINHPNAPPSPDAGGGLSAAEAARRLAANGANELPGGGPRGLPSIVGGVVTEPMFLLLLAAAGIYVVLGDVREALVLAASILIVITITVLQERRSENALARLRDLTSPRALVIRDAIEQRIAGREVVVGDLILLREGDRVPADAVVSAATALSIDESIVTGESLPVDKEATASSDSRDATHLVFSGTLIVRGYGSAVVVATGAQSQIGRIGRELAALTPETSQLFREVRRVVRWVAVAALILCAAIALIYGAARSDWLGGVLAGITVAMGILPEEFPVVLTVFLAMGAWRISRRGVLTRQMPAIESMGAVTVLAVDKTGTLTENRMRVAVIDATDEEDCFDLRHPDMAMSAKVRSILATALAASEREPFDPMERAIHEAAATLAAEESRMLAAMRLVHEYDLTPQLLAVTHVWQANDASPLQVAVKGAPETVFDLCRVPASERQRLQARIAVHAQDGLRVLAVARGEYANTSMPESPHSFDLQLLGLLCLADPLRADVPESLIECARAGIRVIMITGDHPGTALAIAKQAGFDVTHGALTGAQFAVMNDKELRDRVRTSCVYARTSPQHKLRLIQALKANGEIVAMTGDGVNDAPALKAAHVGVAMGSRGTDVAREAASLVLVNDDFASLVGAIRLGRRIYDNIRNAMGYLVAAHIPIAGMGLLPVLLGWPLLLFPVHVLFLEFVIDPACSFVFESDQEAADVMRRKPRPPNARLFSATLLRRNLLLGTVILAFAAAIYAVTLATSGADQARALTFIAIVIANLLLILVSRVRDGTGSGTFGDIFRTVFARPNPIFWWIAGATVVLLTATIHVPAIASAFRFAPPPALAIAAVAAASVALVPLSAALLRRRRVTAVLPYPDTPAQ